LPKADAYDTLDFRAHAIYQTNLLNCQKGCASATGAQADIAPDPVPGNSIPRINPPNTPVGAPV
jgi:hypothetical protein